MEHEVDFASRGIIDVAGKRRLPIGNENFEQVIKTSVFVDKSLLIRDLIDSPYSAILFCRPRRFGKSLAMRMMQCFFEAPVEGFVADRRVLFEPLAVWGEGEEYRAECGAHPVIFLGLGSARAKSWDEAFDQLSLIMADECIRHRYLLDSGKLGGEEKKLLKRIMAREADRADLAYSLARLSDMLARYHGTGTVILIDEYDQPVTAGHLHGFRAEAVEFYRAWLTGALKGTTSLYRACLTGVQRMSRESVFSGLNNIAVNTPLNTEFKERFGFTARDAEALADYLGLSGKVDEMRSWYDGYCFGGQDVYNPWSLLNYLYEGGVAQVYWGNTSDNAIVHQLFERAEGRTADALASLAAGGRVTQYLDLATVYDMIDCDPDAIWSQLYLAGYLTTEDIELPNDTEVPREMRVPNREVARLYRSEFHDRSKVLAGTPGRLRELHRALTAGDAPAFEETLREMLLDAPSSLDLTSENSYHMFVLGLLYDVRGYRFPKSNREAGDGRADVLIAPERENEGTAPAIVVEVKRAAGGNGGADVGEAELRALAQTALAQVEERSYASAFTREAASGGILKWGVAFGGKRVCAVSR